MRSQRKGSAPLPAATEAEVIGRDENRNEGAPARTASTVLGPSGILAREASLRKLHIGGHMKTEGWEVLDANANEAVDHVGDAGDLSRFGEGTFEAVYASHVLEHFDYKDALPAALREWHRVLAPGGKLYVSVPDLAVLSSMFVLRDQLTIQERYQIMRMMFGGHVDRYDYHQVGLDTDFLATFLGEAGFVNLRKVRSFGLFQDTSEMLFKGIPISLNVIAEKA